MLLQHSDQAATVARMVESLRRDAICKFQITLVQLVVILLDCPRVLRCLMFWYHPPHLEAKAFWQTIGLTVHLVALNAATYNLFIVVDSFHPANAETELRRGMRRA